jgi:hypothetical protein
MEDIEMIQLWKSYGHKLDQTLQLNRQNAADITKMKVQSFLASMKPIKIFTVVVGICWVAFVDLIIIKSFNAASMFFLVSAGIQVLLTKLAIGIYLYHLVLIHETDISEPVWTTQNRLARLKSSTLWVARILFLQLPVWTTFYWSSAMFKHGNPVAVALQVLVALVFSFAAIWLFRNIRFENRNKKWFRLMFEGKEWTPVMKSIELLGQVEEE